MTSVILALAAAVFVASDPIGPPDEYAGIAATQEQGAGVQTQGPNAPAAPVARQQRKRVFQPKRVIAAPQRGASSPDVPRVVPHKANLLKADASAGDARAAARQVAVLTLRNVPVQDVTQAIGKWSMVFRDARDVPPPVVTSVDVANTLLVTGTSQQVDTIRQIVTQLDQPRAQVRVRMAIVDVKLDPPAESSISIPATSLDEAIAALKKRGEVCVIARPDIRAIDGEEAHFQMAGRVPKIVGVTVSSRGQTNTVDLENVGTLLQLTPRVTDDNAILVKVNIERSALGPDETATEIAEVEGQTLRTPQVEIMQLETTASLTPGRVVLLGGWTDETSTRLHKMLVLAQAEIIR